MPLDAMLPFTLQAYARCAMSLRAIAATLLLAALFIMMLMLMPCHDGCHADALATPLRYTLLHMVMALLIYTPMLQRAQMFIFFAGCITLQRYDGCDAISYADDVTLLLLYIERYAICRVDAS